jgi:hypothetical protein
MDDINYPKDFRLVSDGNNLFLVRKNGTTEPVTPAQALQIEDAVSQVFLQPLGSGVRVKARKIFD